METAKRFELWDLDDNVLLDRDVDLPDFYRVNDLHPEAVSMIEAMSVGDGFLLGGGAAPAMSLRRTA